MATNITVARGATQQSALGGNRGILQRIRMAVHRWQETARIHGELTHMSTRELADLGLSPSDIPDVVGGTYRRT